MFKHSLAICSLFVVCCIVELPLTIGLNILPVDTNNACFPDRMSDVISEKMDAAKDAKQSEVNGTFTSLLKTKNKKICHTFSLGFFFSVVKLKYISQ